MVSAWLTHFSFSQRLPRIWVLSHRPTLIRILFQKLNFGFTAASPFPQLSWMLDFENSTASFLVWEFSIAINFHVMRSQRPQDDERTPRNESPESWKQKRGRWQNNFRVKRAKFRLFHQRPRHARLHFEEIFFWIFFCLFVEQTFMFTVIVARGAPQISNHKEGVLHNSIFFSNGGYFF